MNASTITILIGALLILSSLFGVMLYRRNSGHWIDKLAIGVIPTLVVIALVHLVGQAFNAPFDTMNGIRLTTAFSIFSDYALYTYPKEGPVVCNMYPPMAHMVFLPATAAPTPTIAIVIASTISLCLVVGSASLILWMFKKKARGTTVAIAVLAAIFLITNSPSIWYSAHRVRPDGAALAFGAMAAAVLLRPREKIAFRTMLICGTFAALAVWTKQVFVFLYPPLVISAIIVFGRRAALQLVFACLISGLIVSAIFFVAFGPIDRMIYNFVTVPSKHPYWDHSIREWTMHVIDFLEDLAIPMIVAGAVVIVSTVGAKEQLGIRRWIQDHRWILFLAMAIGMVPANILNQIKVGGLPNANAFVIFFVMLTGLAGLLNLMNSESHVFPHQMPTGIFLTIAATLGAVSFPQAILHARDATTAFENDNQAVFEYLQGGDETTWFPWQPLGVYMATGKVFHTEEGLCSLHVKSQEPSLAYNEYAKYLPEQFQFIAVPERWNGGLQGKVDYFGPRGQTIKPEHLPGWLLYEMAGENEQKD